MPKDAQQAASTPALFDERLTLVGLLIEINQGLTMATADIHRAHDLLAKEFDALLRLARSDHRSLPMRDLAAQTATSTSGTTNLVDRLEHRALVTRTVSCTDRRSFDVRLTASGRALVADMISDLLPLLHRIVIQPLGSDAPLVQAALERVRNSVAPHATSGSRRVGARQVSDTTQPPAAHVPQP